MPRARPPRSALENFIDLDAIPDIDKDPVSTEDDDDSYLQDIPGVRTLGIKRGSRNAAETTPSKLQAVAPSTPNHENVKERGKTKTEVVDLDEVNDLQTLMRVVKDTQEKVSLLQSQSIKHANEFKEEIVKKEEHVARLTKDNADLHIALVDQKVVNEKLTTKHTQEVTDLQNSLVNSKIEKEGLVVRHNQEITDYNNALLNERVERDRIIRIHNTELTDLQNSFSMEKTVLLDRRRQQMAIVKLKVNLLLEDASDEPQSKVVQVKQERKLGGIEKQ